MSGVFGGVSETVKINVDGPLRVNNSLSASQAAAAGLGLIFLPIFVVSDALERRTLQIILQEWSTEPLTLYAIYPKHRQHSRKIQVFIEFISDTLASLADKL